jgi:hypothetical protein
MTIMLVGAMASVLTSFFWRWRRGMRKDAVFGALSLLRAVREGVSTGSLKFHSGPPGSTLLHLAGGTPFKQPSFTFLNTSRRTGLPLAPLSQGIEEG